MAVAALGFLLVMAVGGAVCGIADLVQGIVARLVSTCVTVTKLSRKSCGGKSYSEFYWMEDCVMRGCSEWA